MSEPFPLNGSDTSRIFPRNKLKNLRFFKSRVKMKNPLILPENLKKNTFLYQFCKPQNVTSSTEFLTINHVSSAHL